ncbi:MAG: hypothetical protein WCT24_00875 [Patescibacteria group bacterium]|jgi:hypothetical protein
MNIKGYLAIFGTGTVLAWIAWGVVLWNIDPFTAGLPMILVFYLTLFAGLMGTIATIATLVRVQFDSENELEEIVSTSLRQAVMLSAMMVGCLFLASKSWFHWWSVLLLIAGVSLIEYFFVSYRNRHS